MNPKGNLASRTSGTDPGLRKILHRLAATCRDPARIVELHYWSAEPELISLLRRYTALPDAPKDALRAFLTMAADCPETVQVTVNNEGHVTLYSPAVTEIMLKTAPLRVKDKRTEAVH